MKREEFREIVEGTISRLTGLEGPDSPDWPELVIKRCADCNILKTN